MGSYRGRSTVSLALGVKESGNGIKVYAIDPHEQYVGILGGKFGPSDRRAFFKNILMADVVEHVRLVNLKSNVASKGWMEEIAFLFLDGDHSYEGVSQDINYWKPHLAPNALVAFDDSLSPSIGPYKIIRELCVGLCERIRVVGKITLVRIKS